MWIFYDSAPPMNGNARLQVFIGLTNGMTLPLSRLQIGFRAARIVVWKQDAMELLSTPAPAPGWHHVAYTFDGTTHRLYVDNAEANTSTVPPDGGAVTFARLGSFHKNEEYFNGRLDDVRIYNRLLTVDEIRDLAAGKE